MTYRLLDQRSQECGLSMWIATIDCSKAFDTIRHEAIWRSLSKFKISEAYISSLEKKVLCPMCHSLYRH